MGPVLPLVRARRASSMPASANTGLDSLAFGATTLANEQIGLDGITSWSTGAGFTQPGRTVAGSEARREGVQLVRCCQGVHTAIRAAVFWECFFRLAERKATGREFLGEGGRMLRDSLAISKSTWETRARTTLYVEAIIRGDVQWTRRNGRREVGNTNIQGQANVGQPPSGCLIRRSCREWQVGPWKDPPCLFYSVLGKVESRYLTDLHCSRIRNVS